MDNTEAAQVAADDTAAAIEAPEQDDAPQPDAVEATSREAIERAFARLDQDAATEAAQAEDRPAADEPDKSKDDRERDENGRFKAKPDDDAVDDAAQDDPKPEPKPEADTFASPPGRFSADAKQAWADAPLPVRAEIDRAIKELESGIEKHRTAFEPFKDFAAELEKNGQTFQQVLGHYRGIENLLAQDPVRGLDQICHNLGTSLRQVAEKVMGQTPDQNAATYEAHIRDLNGKMANLEKQVHGVSTSVQADREAEITRQITDFATQNPRFTELENDIATLLELRKGMTLQAAYDEAARLNPLPADVQPAPAPAAQAETKPKPAQPGKGSLSLSGAPGSGSNPGSKPSGSTRQALDAAFAAAGL